LFHFYDSFGSISLFWTTKTLLDLFDHLINQNDFPFNLCLFIDGLDQLSCDLDEAVEFLNEVSAFAHFKICLSSRPWPIFEDAFDGCPNLKLHHLTQDDIKTYVHSRLQDADMLRSSAVQVSSERPLLVGDIVSKASGVFQWVSFAVKALLEGLRNQDDISDLRRGLQLLPPDIEQLYDHILAQVDPFYHAQCSRLLQITIRAGSSLSGLQLYFAEENTETVLGVKLRSTSKQEQLEMMFDLQRWVASRCAGLLEVKAVEDPKVLLFDFDSRQARFKVQLMHRTVVDYLCRRATCQELQRRVEGSGFDANVSLTRSCVLLLKHGFKQLGFQEDSKLMPA